MSAQVAARPLCVAIAGPTASGKSALALAAAARWPLEIISVDSAQIYRGLDIGTAKPSAAERAAVPHHLIDIIAPNASYSAARFVADARRLIGEIHGRGHHALLVGGTMLYFKALFDGLDAMPPSNAAVRANLDARATTEGWPALHAELALVDPASAARLPPGDSQRIQRALEVFALSGRPLSSFFGQARQGGLSMPLLALMPSDRNWLHRRIAERFDAMLSAGLVHEVAALRQRAELSADLPAMRCVGYRQAWQALDAGDMAPLRERGTAATRQLAKRQLTWLRSLPHQPLACDAADALPAGMRALAGWLNKPAASAEPPST